MSVTKQKSADANFVFTGNGEIVEVQGTAEAKPFTRDDLEKLLNLAFDGCAELTTKQLSVVSQKE